MVGAIYWDPYIVSASAETQTMCARNNMQTPQPMTEGQLKEAGQLLTKPFVDHGVTDVDYQEVILRDPDFKGLLQASGDYVRRFIARRDSVVPYLFANALPSSGFEKANTALTYDWSKRENEDARLKQIAALYGKAYGIGDVVLEDNVVNMPAWQTCLVVLLPDLAIQRGVDPEILADERHAQKYVELVRPLCDSFDPLKQTDWFKGCLKKDGAKANEKSLESYLAMIAAQKKRQEKGKALIVRRMAVNPAIWFEVDGVQYSFAPIHTPALFAGLPFGNKVKKVLPGDLVITTTLLAGEPHLVHQIKAGTCPRIDQPGTDLRDGRSWSFRPYVDRFGSEAWIGNYFTGNAYGYFGSLGCAWE